jgi:outer membrane protein assembly factor BamA
MRSRDMQITNSISLGLRSIGLGIIFTLSFNSLSIQAQVQVQSPELPKKNSIKTSQCKSLITTPTSYALTDMHEAMKALQLPEYFIVGEVKISRLNVFDEGNPDESGGAFQVANQLHWLTHESVIRDQLLFESGDEIQVTQLSESERILRGNHFIYDAEVIVRRQCGNKFDIEIITRDVWTLTPDIRLKRSGGQSDVSFVIRDSSFLGTGKSIAVESKQDENSRGFGIRYFDPAVFGSRHKLNLEYEDNDDGHRNYINLRKPFFSLQSQQSYGVSYDDDLGSLWLYDNGEEVNQFSILRKESEMFYGWSAGSKQQQVERYRIGFNHQRVQFDITENTSQQGIPNSRDLGAFWVDYEFFEDDFVKIANIEQLHRREDINLGDKLYIKLGWVASIFDSDRTGPMLKVSGQHYLQADIEKYLQLSYEADLFYNNDTRDFENSTLKGTLSFNYLQTEQWRFHVQANATHVRHAYMDNPMVLGGENGLRGFPRAYAHGNSKFLLTLEERYFSDLHIWQLIRVGGAIFVDAGKTFNGERDHWLASAGAGLRLSSSRAEIGKVLHLDIAFPINDRELVDSYQWLVTVKQSF